MNSRKTIVIQHNGLYASKVAHNLDSDIDVIIAGNDFTFDNIQQQLNLPNTKDISPDKETIEKILEINYDHNN
jgi:sensor domain CHASE-containing protein